jgi:hypothetical protein
MNEVVTLEPWDPWLLFFPALVMAAGVVASIRGTRRDVKPLREAGYVAFVLGALTVAGMTWTLSGIWDSQQREGALVRLGYETVTFSGGMDLSGGELPPIAFQAEWNGERVRGVLRPLGGDQWEVVEIDD